jgi:phytoene synthase
MGPVLESLSPVNRLALSYAPKSARAQWLGWLGLDTRLAQLVREAREPMLAQIRLAWWRERLAEPADRRPAGEPLLALLGDRAEALAPLVDGWEALLGDAPLPRDALSDFADGRARALGGLAEALGASRQAGKTAGRCWALADLASRLSHPEERSQVAALWAEAPAVPRLPRAMRPLVVLHGLASRDRNGPFTLLTAMRLGIFGR